MPRIQFANGQFYHLYNRGTEKRKIFLDNLDYRRFLLSMELMNEKKDGLMIAWRDYRTANPSADLESFLRFHLKERRPLVDFVCFSLLPNHYHFLVRQVEEGGISEFMRRIGISYTMYFNEKYSRVGVLFQGAFRAVLVKTNHHLFYLSAYVNCNSEVHRIARAETKLLEAENDLNVFQTAVNDTLSAMIETENILTQRVLNHEDRIKALEDKIATLSVQGGGALPTNVVTQDAQGNVVLAGILRSEKVEANGVVAGSFAVKNDEKAPTSGEGVIVSVKLDANGDGWDDTTAVDGKSARVRTTAVTESAKIFVTFEGDPGSRWWVEKIRNPETGELTGEFSVNVKDPVPADIKFSWFIIESR